MPQMAENNYWGKLVSYGLDTAENGNPFLLLTFEITHQAANGAWEELPRPIKRNVKLRFTGGAWEYTEKKLDTLGFNGDFTDAGMKFGEAPQKEGVELACKHEAGLGKHADKTFENWDLANWGTRERKAPADDVARDLAARWRNRQANMAKPAGSPAQPPTRPAASEPNPADRFGDAPADQEPPI